MRRNLSIWGNRGTRALLGAALLLMPASCIPMASAVGGQLGKAIVRAARQDEPAEVTEPTEPQRVERAGFSLQFPGNWQIDTQGANYDPDHMFIIQASRSAFVGFEIYDRQVDPRWLLAARVAAMTGQVLPGAEREEFPTWGQYRGQGALLYGRAMGKTPVTVRIFAFAWAGHTVAVTEYTSDNDSRNVEPGFQMVEQTFRVMRAESVDPRLSPAAGKLKQARGLFFAGRAGMAVSLILQTLNDCDSGCASQDRVAAWLLLGCIRAIGDRDGAKKAFAKALSLDRRAVLDPTVANVNAIAAFKEAQQAFAPELAAPTAPPPPSIAVTPPAPTTER